MCSVNSVQCAVFGMHYQVCTVKCALSSLRCSVFRVQYTVCRVQRTVYSVQFRVNIVVCVVQFEVCCVLCLAYSVKLVRAAALVPELAGLVHHNPGQEGE